MGKVEAKVILTNAYDEEDVRRGYKKPLEIRKVEAIGLPDTGVTRLVLPEETVKDLNLSIIGQTIAQYADGRVEKRDLAGAVKIQIDSRSAITDCIVGQAQTKILIGQVVLEAMDLYVDCKLGKLIPRPGHEDMPLMEIL